MTADRRPLVAGLALIVGACGFDPVSPSEFAPPPDVRMYVDTAVNFTEAWFYFNERIDWQALRSRLDRDVIGATTFKDVHPAIDTMVRSLRDRHSFFYKPTQTAGTSNPPPEVAFHRPLGKSFAPRIGYVWLPMFVGTNQPARADSIQRAIAKVDSTPDLCGWIVDLRGNPGGFWPPMLAGLSPLIPEGGVGGYVLRDPTQRYLYEVHPGAAGVRLPTGDYFEFLRLPSAYQVRNPALPIAILQTGLTASAGEILIMALRDPSRASRSFGANTFGATTQPFTKVFRDTASIQITAGVFFDKFDARFENYVIPVDQAVSGPAINTSYVPGAATDAVIDAASAWLRTQPACAAGVRAESGVRAQESGVRAQASGRWVTPPRVPGARPVREWPAGIPVPWRTGPVRAP